MEFIVDHYQVISVSSTGFLLPVMQDESKTSESNVPWLSQEASIGRDKSEVFTQVNSAFYITWVSAKSLSSEALNPSYRDASLW